MARTTRLERATGNLVGTCSIQLSYARNHPKTATHTRGLFFWTCVNALASAILCVGEDSFPHLVETVRHKRLYVRAAISPKWREYCQTHPWKEGDMSKLIYDKNHKGHRVTIFENSEQGLYTAWIGRPEAKRAQIGTYDTEAMALKAALAAVDSDQHNT